jgi:hypothetical protein
MRIQIKIKNKSEDNYKFLIEGWNWKEKQILKKDKKNQKNGDKIEKTNIL